MKVGILTYHRATNYGAVLQSFGLITRLKKDFPNITFELIDYSTLNAFFDHKKEEFSALKNGGFKHFFEIRKKNKMFEKFSNQLPLSKYKIVSNNTSKIFKKMNKRYDAVIVGSDAVFSWNGKKFPTAYYLDCHSKYKKISYAASSHRLFYRESTNYQRNYCYNTLKNYDYIGVRDGETEKMIAYFGPELKVSHNCDPSFLIDQGLIYEKGSLLNLNKKYNIPSGKVIILMSSNEKLGQEIKNKFPDFVILSLFVKNKFSDVYLPCLEPFEWASIFKIAVLTVSEYFHATIFSLKCGTPALAIDTLRSSDGYEGKIHDLLIVRLKLNRLYLNIEELEKKQYSILGARIDSILNDKMLPLMIKESIEEEASAYSAFYNYFRTFIENE